MRTVSVASHAVISVAVIAPLACSHPTPPTPVETPLAGSPKAVAACDTPEHRQLDFWVGDWDVVVHARQTPDGPFADAKGRQHVESILGGCAVAETFSADGPGPAWNG